MPKSAFNTNFTSAIHALLFVTNLVRPLGMEDYAEKVCSTFTFWGEYFRIRTFVRFYGGPLFQVPTDLSDISAMSSKF